MSENTMTAFEAAKLRLEQIKSLVQDGTLTDREDFGMIQGIGKPSLFKPGAQKIMALFGLASEVRNVQRHADGTGVNYCVTVTLRDKQTGGLESEGVGSCDSRERKYARQSAPDIDNTILKMARKRALIDAVLDATGASSIFTQDVEDMAIGDNHAPRPQSAPQRPQPPQNGQRNGNGAPQTQACPKCHGPMWDNRAKKTNPKQPDFNCKNRDGCDGVIWPKKAKHNEVPQSPTAEAKGANE